MSPFVQISKAQRDDSAAIADLHRRHIPWGLLSHLGGDVVAAFYQTLIQTPCGFVLVAEQDGRMIGFASGVTAWRRFYLEFLRRNAGTAFRVLLRRLHAGRWRRVLEATRYAASPKLPSAELVSIAVDPDARGRGIAQELVRCVLEEFGARGIRAVRVTTDGSNVRAGGLYEKMGFSLLSEAEIHPGERALIYVRTIEPGGASATL